MTVYSKDCENCSRESHTYIVCDYCGIECCSECVPHPDDDDKDWCGICTEEEVGLKEEEPC